MWMKCSQRRLAAEGAGIVCLEKGTYWLAGRAVGGGGWWWRASTRVNRQPATPDFRSWRGDKCKTRLDWLQGYFFTLLPVK